MQKKFAYHKPLFLKVLKKALFNFKFFKKIYRFITKTAKPVVFNLTKLTNLVLFRKKEPYKFKHLLLRNKFFHLNFSVKNCLITMLSFKTNLFKRLRNPFFFIVYKYTTF